MKRRRFLRNGMLLVGASYLAGCGLPTLPWLRQDRIPHVGMLKQPPELNYIDAFREGMREHGYVEGETYRFDYRYVEQADRVPEAAAELAQIPVDVMVCPNSLAVEAARQASSTIPIVFVNISDPIAFGYVNSLARPGGNLTGTSHLTEGMTGKRLQILQETQPGLSSVGVFVVSQDATTEAQVKDAEAAAQQLGLRVIRLQVTTPQSFPDALDHAVQVGAEALFMPIHQLVMQQLQLIARFAAQHKLPAMAFQRQFADGGGLMSYGPSVPGLYKRGAYYVHRILKGDKPADIPVEQPTTFDFVVNLSAARAIGLTIPQSVLQQATEVIQ